MLSTARPSLPPLQVLDDLEEGAREHLIQLCTNLNPPARALWRVSALNRANPAIALNRKAKPHLASKPPKAENSCSKKICCSGTSSWKSVSRCHARVSTRLTSAGPRLCAAPSHPSRPPHRGSRNKSGMTMGRVASSGPKPHPSPRPCAGVHRAGRHAANGSSPSPTARSFHAGFSRSIRLRFQSRRQRLSCFSRPIAPSIDSPVSK